MKRTLSILIVVALVGAFAVAPAAAQDTGPNEEQSGDNGACVDYNALYLVGGVTSPVAATIVVDGGTNFTAAQSGGAGIYIDFYDDAGEWVGWNEGATEGTAPSSAVTGIVCVGLLGTFPDAPAVGATWTYQDGFDQLPE